MAIGLNRVLGKKPLYLSMLRNFIIGQRSVVTEILNELEDGSWDIPERLAHTLKGVSGSIGAAGLQQLAATLETSIRERRPRQEIEARLDELNKPLTALIAQLEQQLPQKLIDATVTVSPQQLAAVCDKLKALLADDDAEAYDALDSNADMLYAAFPDHYSRIDDGIRTFDFKAALAALEAATAASA